MICLENHDWKPDFIYKDHNFIYNFICEKYLWHSPSFTLVYYIHSSKLSLPIQLTLKFNQNTQNCFSLNPRSNAKTYTAFHARIPYLANILLPKLWALFFMPQKLINFHLNFRFALSVSVSQICFSSNFWNLTVEVFVLIIPLLKRAICKRDSFLVNLIGKNKLCVVFLKEERESSLQVGMKVLSSSVYFESKKQFGLPIETAKESKSLKRPAFCNYLNLEVVNSRYLFIFQNQGTFPGNLSRQISKNRLDSR